MCVFILSFCSHFLLLAFRFVDRASLRSRLSARPIASSSFFSPRARHPRDARLPCSLRSGSCSMRRAGEDPTKEGRCALVEVSPLLAPRDSPEVQPFIAVFWSRRPLLSFHNDPSLGCLRGHLYRNERFNGLARRERRDVRQELKPLEMQRGAGDDPRS